MQPDSHVETEGKWRLRDAHDAERVRLRLGELGATWTRTEHEVNQIFDLPDGSLQRTDRLLRLRIIDGGPAATLTVKGARTMAAGIKSREELETTVADAAVAKTMFERLGYALTVEYPKLRETWRLGTLEIALDELPFGRFCEIEGPAAEIAAAAQSLHLDAIEPRGYPSLMTAFLASSPSI